MIEKVRRNSIRKKNRKLNAVTIQHKVFCIGLHKTGTTTLSNYFEEYGFKSLHSTRWIINQSKLKKYDFFSDGGSHFDNINEFDFERLFNTFNNAKFILQTRDAEPWIISKLQHAGWDENTKIQENDSAKIMHDDWKYKSYLTIKKIIEHKFNYEQKVKAYFKKNNSDRLLILDITRQSNRQHELQRLNHFLNLRSINEIPLPHSNRNDRDTSISYDVINFAKQTISNCETLNVYKNEQSIAFKKIG